MIASFPITINKFVVANSVSMIEKMVIYFICNFGLFLQKLYTISPRAFFSETVIFINEEDVKLTLFF